MIAPCSANTLAKISGGVCDNLVTSLLRALPPILPTSTEAQVEPPPSQSSRGVQVWIFPAMNTYMYEHPLTAKHLELLKDLLNYRVVGPIGQSLNSPTRLAMP